jgi:hypothetical protein
MPSVAVTIFTGYIPAAARATAAWLLCLRVIERLFEDLDLRGFAAQRPLQFANPLLEPAECRRS